MKKIFISISFILFALLMIEIYFDLSIHKMNIYHKVAYGKGLEKKFQKLESINSNKIVITGGSNVSFGIDSDLIENKLEIPTINMGLHAAFGSFIYIETIIPYLKKGDVLLISCEYGAKLYEGSKEVTNYFGYMPFKAKFQVYKNLKAVSPLLKNYTKISQENILKYNFEKQLLSRRDVYSYDAFKNDNLYEDKINSEMTDKMYNSFTRRKLLPNNNLELLTYFKDLKNKLDKLEVEVLFVLPAAAKNRISKQESINFYKNLSVKTNIKLLSERTYLYPKDSMLNSEYHLNSKGRKDRSIKVSKDLAITLKQPIRNIKNSFLITNEIKKKFDNTYKLNDILYGRLKENNLEFYTTTKNINQNNYYRVRVKGDVFEGKTLRIELKGNIDDILDDIFFRAVGGLESWDEVIKSNNNYVFIKKNMVWTFYKDGFSYAGIQLKNLNKHDKKIVEIISVRIHDSADSKENNYIELEDSINYIIQPNESNVKINKIVEQLQSSKLDLKHNFKYFFLKENNILRIRDLYEGKTHLFNVKSNEKLILNGIDKLVEITELN
jgi:hypothetical protein